MNASQTKKWKKDVKEGNERFGGYLVAINRIGEEKINNQGCSMKIVEYNKFSNIVVEFQDEHKYKVNNTYGNFKAGCIKNPYYPSVYGVGITGIKYPTHINCKNTKEYHAWTEMLRRCFDEEHNNRQPTYKEVICCEEWLFYENFYEWLHSQPNFDKWYNGKRWAIDKDILFKRNKFYSPNTCCLVPQNVNCLFTKREADRGKYPIGVKESEWGFEANCHNPFINRSETLGSYATPELAFNAYKKYKENLIKKVAQIEFEAGNITEDCYQAMMNYQVEIDD